MSYAKLIHEFLDEGLNGPEEDSLFAELNRNSELRNEFNQQVKMHVLAQNDMASIAPPLATTSAIFASLGFSVPVADYNKPEPLLVSSTKFKSALGRYLPTIVAVFLSAAITTAIVMMLSGTPESSNYALKAVGNLSYGVNIGQLPPQQSIAPVQYPVMSSNETQPSRQYTRPAPNRALVAVNNTINERPTSPVEKTIPIIDTYMSLTPIELPGKEQVNTLSGQNETYTSLMDNNSDRYLQSEDFNSPEGLSDITRYEFQLKAANGFLFDFGGNYPQINQELKANSVLENGSLGIYYHLDKNFAVGVEAGFETFPLDYIYNSNGVQIHEQKNPSLFWYGANIKYSLVDILPGNFLFPYAQLTLGGTNIGFHGRAQAGLSVNLMKGIGVNAGYEYSSVQYTIEKSHTSSRHGLTVGVSYRPW